jgi:hypothetical protein
MVREVEYVRNRVPPARMEETANAARHTVAPKTDKFRANDPNGTNASPDRGRPRLLFSDFLHPRSSLLDHQIDGQRDGFIAVRWLGAIRMGVCEPVASTYV